MKEKKDTKDKTKTVTLRLPSELYEQIQTNADNETRSFNLQVIHYLKQIVNLNNTSK